MNKKFWKYLSLEYPLSGYKITVQGATPFKLYPSANQSVRAFKLYGQTNTTTLESCTNANVTVSGINLIKTRNGTVSSHGVTLTCEDGIFTLNGTSDTTNPFGLNLPLASDCNIPIGLYYMWEANNPVFMYLNRYGSTCITSDQCRINGAVTTTNVPNQIGIWMSGDRLTKTYDNFKIYPVLVAGAVPPTRFQPYINPSFASFNLTNPIRKVNNYADYIDNNKGALNAIIKQLTLTGAENWIKSELLTFELVLSEPHIVSNLENPNSLCDNLDLLSENGTYTHDNDGYEITTSRLIIYTNATENLTVDEFKAYLSANPITLDYVLDEYNVIETFSPQFLTLKKGYDYIVSNDNTIKPSSTEITYNSYIKE